MLGQCWSGPHSVLLIAPATVKIGMSLLGGCIVLTRSSCIMGELEDELKRERETRFHCRHVDGLGLGASLNIIFGLFYWLMHHVKEDSLPTF